MAEDPRILRLERMLAVLNTQHNRLVHYVRQLEAKVMRLQNEQAKKPKWKLR